MTTRHAAVKAWNHAVQARTAVKMITGIANTNMSNILDVVNAANAVNGVTALDVAANADIVKAVVAQTELMVFASHLEPAVLVEAVQAGAHGVELGNYDALYDSDVFITAEDVLTQSQALMAQLEAAGLRADTVVSVTIPGHLGEDAQVRLAVQLEALGVDILQTEGAARALSNTPKTATLSSAEKVELTCKNTRVLSAAVSIPVMSATGMSSHTVAQAIQAGAAAVGVGRAVSQLNSVEAMVAELQAIVHTVASAAVQLQNVAKLA